MATKTDAKKINIFDLVMSVLRSDKINSAVKASEDVADLVIGILKLVFKK